ncbi:hypothetical protein A3860_00395 [Niastella vici]|uniref:Uncharacterized protein n=1 Tax=Niastella vici TaxID=1703345 RepID=A0A1V9G8B7_9BACT|nr:hypothetical protein [Niastella vici]OQP66863.1 hypothetical protein A3860_00395 [Niastella vici]
MPPRLIFPKLPVIFTLLLQAALSCKYRFAPASFITCNAETTPVTLYYNRNNPPVHRFDLKKE